MNHQIHFQVQRVIKDTAETREKIVTTAPPFHPRAYRQVESEVRVGAEQDSRRSNTVHTCQYTYTYQPGTVLPARRRNYMNHNEFARNVRIRMDETPTDFMKCLNDARRIAEIYLVSQNISRFTKLGRTNA